MTKGSDSVRQMHEFLDDVDWDLVQEAADLGEAAVRFVRRHPWVLIAAGSILSGVGAWQAFDNRRHKQHTDWMRQDQDELDLMAP